MIFPCYSIYIVLVFNTLPTLFIEYMMFKLLKEKCHVLQINNQSCILPLNNDNKIKTFTTVLHVSYTCKLKS